MRALLLAAGLGTRLRPLTFHRAKAALPLLNVPFIRYPLQYLYSNQVREVVINLHAHPESVQNAAGVRLQGMRISYSHESEILGTAGAIRNASPMLGDEPFIVMNSDMLMDIPIQRVLEQHRQLDADVTLVIIRSNRFPRYSGLYFDDSNPPKLVGFQEGKGEKFHYSGLQIVSPRVVPRIPENQKTEVFRDIYPRMVSEQKIYGFVYNGFWMEAGTLMEYLQTSLQLLKEPLPSHLQPPNTGSSLISEQATVEPGAGVTDSIVMAGAVIKAGARVDRCIVGWDVTVSGKIRNAALARGILPWYL